MSSNDNHESQLAIYRPWLRLLAGLEIHSRYQGKFSASDVVQQTMLEAWRHWDDFRGDEEGRRAWLRQILAFQLAKLGRAYGETRKRDIRRERSIEASMAESSLRLADILPSDQTSPTDRAIANEQHLRLCAALERLPADYRHVIMLRNMQELSYEQISQQMDRSVGAVKMLWVRALQALKHAMA
ncbi:MAG: sigma-70 family RNA polymerase sigma factor [Pirellulaceae bacterium]